MKRTKTVLLVDDDDFSTYISKSAFKRLAVEAEILTAKDGREALEILREVCHNNNCPDLVLLDIYMPVMGGFEFIKELQNSTDISCADMKIVFLSSSLHDLELAKAKKLPVAGCVEKPLTPEKLSKFL
jgi:CheY-like chemotaxis protein